MAFNVSNGAFIWYLDLWFDYSVHTHVSYIHIWWDGATRRCVDASPQEVSGSGRIEAMRINNVCFWRVQALGGNAWRNAWNLFFFHVTTQDISKEWAWSTKILSFHAKLGARDEACIEPSPDIAALFERIFAAATFCEENKTFLQDFVNDGANTPNTLGTYDFKLILCQFRPHWLNERRRHRKISNDSYTRWNFIVLVLLSSLYSLYSRTRRRVISCNLKNCFSSHFWLRK